METLLSDPSTRLVTIVGPGGMGKTRLAIAAAERILESGDGVPFRPNDGIFFVDLAPLNEAQLIPFAVAEALEIELIGAGGGPGAQLVDFLSDKTMLFILDNVEHLLDGTRLLADIGRASPNIQLLVTSRERLGLRGEQIYTLPGLDFTDWATLEEATGYSAVQLFTGAARRMSADFMMTDDDLPHLTRLCQLVGGMPLALELAAGWVELLPILNIAHEIERGLGLLETDLQDVPDRQRSIQTVFESTWIKAVGPNAWTSAPYPRINPLSPRMKRHTASPPLWQISPRDNTPRWHESRQKAPCDDASSTWVSPLAPTCRWREVRPSGIHWRSWSKAPTSP